MNETPLFEIKNVAKCFSKGNERITIFDNLTMHIASEHFIAIMGPSGS